MYKRLIDKSRQPTLEEIYGVLGSDGAKLLDELEHFLYNHYDLFAELKFPFGNDYGWGKKYSHKSKHLCYVFFEKEAFTVTIQLGKNELAKLYEKLPVLSSKTKELWENRYPCDLGGWIHYRVLNNEDLKEVVELISIKKKPIRK